MINGYRHWLLSGGIGTGKSRVRGLLGRSGWHVVDSDAVGHGVIEPEGPAFREVAARWPEVLVDGRIDRSALGQIVFSDLDQLEELERITHPHIFGTIWSDIEENDGPVAVEIPLLVNPFGPRWKRLVVDCTDGERLARLIDRGMGEKDALERMAAQPKRSEWLASADLVLPNHGSLEELELTVLRLVA